LIHFADTQLSKLNKGWKRKNTTGNRPTVQLEGIDSVTAERLSEESIDCIQHMALCQPDELAAKTNFSSHMVRAWKDQAILMTLVGDIYIDNKSGGVNKHSSKGSSLIDILNKKLGIHTITGLVDLWEKIINAENPKEKQLSFFAGIGIFESKGKNFDQLCFLFENVTKQGNAMKNNYLKELKCDMAT
jgi:hypothetical protein